MNLLHSHLIARKRYLERLLAEMSGQLADALVGNLRVRNDKGIPRYYHVINQGDTQGKYIPKKARTLLVSSHKKIIYRSCINRSEKNWRTLIDFSISMERRIWKMYMVD